MKKNSLGLAASCAAIALFASAPTFAGEVNGNGDPIPATDNAASVCSFSGLNDHPNGAPGDFPGRVQNFGAFLKFLAEVVLGFRVNPLDAPAYPGANCNPNGGGE